MRDCEYMDVLQLRSSGELRSITSSTVCGPLGSQEIWVGYFKSRDYDTSGSDFHLPETPGYYEVDGSFNCSDDDLAILGPDPDVGGGAWIRATGDLREALDALFRLECSDHWYGCYSDAFGYQPCVDDDDCLHGMCDPFNDACWYQ